MLPIYLNNYPHIGNHPQMRALINPGPQRTAQAGILNQIGLPINVPGGFTLDPNHLPAGLEVRGPDHINNPFHKMAPLPYFRWSR